MAEQLLPRDAFSVRLRDLKNNPGAMSVGATVHVVDDYGNLTSWIVQTFRADGLETVFLQWNDADGGDRLLLPSAVAAALASQRDRLVAQGRRRAARRAVETKREKGIPIGNAEALRKARGKRKGGR